MKKSISKRQMLKRTLAVVLALAMTITGLPITALAETAADSSRDYPVAQMTYTAGSEEPSQGLPNEGPVRLAFDENETTYWHSSWTKDDVSNGNFWVEMKLAEATSVDAVRYLPRGEGNGDIGGYKIEGTADGETWTLLTEGTWEHNADWKIAEFEAVELVGIRLTATSTYSDYESNVNFYANAREIRVRTAEAEVPEESGIKVSERVQGIMDEMTLEEKVAQMMMVDFRYWDEDLTDEEGQVGFTVMNDQIAQVLADYKFGALIYFAQNIVETEQSYNLTMAVQEAATSQGGLPMIISADQEGGSVYRLGSGTALPGNMALGATGDTEYAKKAGQIIGSELSVLGINTTLAPVVDVNNNANNPVIGLRSYGDDATAVGQMAAANIQGLAQYNVIGCAKHFPGHGDTATDSHYGLPMVDKSLDVLLENELKPYEVAIDEGIEMIMTAHILYPQLESDTIVSEKTGEAESLPATMSDDILTGLLKGDMGFKGIIVTDAMNMAGIADKWNQVQSVKIAIAAGVDMICMPCTLYNLEDLADLDAILDGVVAAVESGEIPESRINDAVARILTVKENRGILDWSAEDYSLEKALATVGSDENRATEREIASAAVTVVKNENNVLPLELTSESNVLMLVPYTNEISQMLMAWNRAVDAGIIPYGAEVDYYRFSSATIDETLQEKLDWANVVIINSEISSTSRMAYKHWLSALPNAVADYCKENGKISVISSVDKPYDVQLYPNADAVLAAYGCKGSSVDVTEALVGGATGSAAAYGPNIIAGVEVALGTFGAQGTLPVNVPVYDVESNTYTEEIAYARGYGLTYEAKTAITVDKAVLEAAITKAAEVTDATIYADSTEKAFVDALAAAQAVAADENAVQYNVEKAAAELTAAQEALELPADNAELSTVVAEAKTLEQITVTSAYTDESWAALTEAIAAADEVLAVEATAAEIEAAKAGLEAAQAGLENVAWIALDTVVATVGDYETEGGAYGEGGAEFVIDANTETKWHTEWYPEDNNTHENHWLQFELDSLYAVDSYYYLPRQDSSTNGSITEYQIQVSLDGENWTTVSEGTWTTDKDWKVVTFEPVKANYVRLNTVNADSDQPTKKFASAAEVRVAGVVAADSAALEAKVAEYAAVDTTVYTEESAAAFTAALAAAEEVAANVYATQEEIEAALATLETAYAALEVAVVEPVYIPVESIVGITAGDEELVNSDQSVEGPVELAIDGNTGTFWHTDWYVGDNHDNHWLQLELDSAYLVSGFEYLPRQSNGSAGNTNGTITSYKILVSEDGVNFTEVTAGDWAADSSWKSAEFDAVKAKYVRLKAEAAESDIGIALACAAEVKLLGTVVECAEHTTELRGAVEATCTTPGHTGNEVCTNCLAVIVEGTEIPALGHTWGEAVVTPATCTEDGSSVKTCATCGEEEVEVLPATGHDLGEWTVAKDATCAEAGSKEAVCATCGETVTEEIEALGHTWGEWTEVKAATCSEAGSEERVCSVCNEKETREIAVLDHTWGEWTVVKAATAKEAGLEEHVCTVCGEKEEREIPMLDFENPFVDVTEDKWYYDAVMWGAMKDIVAGITETEFGPKVNSTRAQIVSFLWRAAGRPEPETEECKFTDVDSSKWYYKAVLWATENGYVAGYTETTFVPNATCKRAEMATFLWRMAGKPEAEGSENPFYDVAAGKWYETAAQWSYENGIVSGYDLEEGKAFAPDNQIARGETVTMLYRFFNEK